MRVPALLAMMALVPLGTGGAQTDTSALERLGGSYFGPRLGLTYLTRGVMAELEDKDIDIAPVIMQFGWQ